MAQVLPHLRMHCQHLDYVVLREAAIPQERDPFQQRLISTCQYGRRPTGPVKSHIWSHRYGAFPGTVQAQALALGGLFMLHWTAMAAAKHVL